MADPHGSTTAGEAATVKLVRFHELGSASVLKLEDVPVTLGQGEVLLRNYTIGLNRAEVVFRKGQYLVQPELPSLIGYEASGVVEAVGPGVDPALVGQKRSTVPAFMMGKYGTYGEVSYVPADALAAYPDSLSFEEATSIWMQYITAWGALMHFGKMTAGDFVLIPAASSSVGLAAIEMARAEGAKPIALTRTAEKKQELLDFGAAHVVITEQEDLVARVREITGGKLARLVFDPVGGPTFAKLAEATAPQGHLFLYGALSPEPTPFPNFAVLSKHLTIRGYTLFEINAEPEIRRQAEQYVFEKLQSGAFKPRIAKAFPLSEIVEAQKYMESNQQIGKVVVTVP